MEWAPIAFARLWLANKDGELTLPVFRAFAYGCVKPRGLRSPLSEYSKRRWIGDQGQRSRFSRMTCEYQ
ncbi:hypothetical protein SAMN05444166_6338 [Singulisphaera sp. GP187]|nr:hypothetical protein SAMN05444166_6338 [Singulisphaera sp. GP187]